MSLIILAQTDPWVIPVQVVPKKGGMTVVKNEKDELIPQLTVTGWRVCIDYRKLNNATRKDHFPLPFIDQMLERLAGHEYYCFLDGFSGYFPGRSRENHIHLPLRDICIQTNAIRIMQCPGHLFRPLPKKSRKDAKKVRGDQPCIKLGKMPFHGEGRNRPRAQGLRFWN
ncbi:hypothetical protein Tco_0978496 [Tanacetum coccineum]|uniref:Reverse transcriptase domain-containing protein n=1 Tax=Tanacetum coccineum TaxID=301880 RepID=A0ABQ5EN13_9ASTR